MTSCEQEPTMKNIELKKSTVMNRMLLLQSNFCFSDDHVQGKLKCLEENVAAIL